MKRAAWTALHHACHGIRSVHGDGLAGGAAGVEDEQRVLGAPGYFWASFDIGMGMADTFQINGGDYSPWAGPLYALSFAALIALIAVGASVLLRRRTPAAGR